MKVNVLSWNIQEGHNLEACIQFIEQIAPDIVCLQEVVESYGTNTAQSIATALGYKCIYYQTLAKPKQNFYQGNAILTKCKIEESTFFQLSDYSLYANTIETEPRNAVKATVKINETLYSIINTHLGYSTKYETTLIKDMQFQNLKAQLSSNNTILTGDFNSLPESSYIKQLEKQMHNTLPSPLISTYHTNDDNLIVIDYIFITKDINCTESRIITSKLSDHNPIFAILDL